MLDADDYNVGPHDRKTQNNMGHCDNCEVQAFFQWCWQTLAELLWLCRNFDSWSILGQSHSQAAKLKRVVAVKKQDEAHEPEC